MDSLPFGLSIIFHIISIVDVKPLKKEINNTYYIKIHWVSM